MDLEKYARSRDSLHLPAWQAFNKNVGGNGSVGIWHETYQIDPGKYEVFYGNMPLFGLSGAAKGMAPVTSSAAQSARGRMTGEQASS